MTVACGQVIDHDGTYLKGAIVRKREACLDILPPYSHKGPFNEILDKTIRWAQVRICFFLVYVHEYVYLTAVYFVIYCRSLHFPFSFVDT